MTRVEESKALSDEALAEGRLRLRRKASSLRTKAVQFRVTKEELAGIILDAEKNDDASINDWARRKAGLAA